MLRILSLNGGRVVTTEALLRQVWGRRGSDDTDRVRTVVKKLRHKLGDDAGNPTYVFNEHGVGYRFARPGPVMSPGDAAAAPSREDSRSITRETKSVSQPGVNAPS